MGFDTPRELNLPPSWILATAISLYTRFAAVSRINVMEDTEGAVHYTFADNLAPYFLLVFSPIVVIFCLFGISYTYITTEVS